MDSLIMLGIAAVFLAIVIGGAVYLKKKQVNLEENKNAEIILTFLSQLTEIVYESFEDETEEKKYLGYIYDMTKIGVSILKSMEDVQDGGDAEALKIELFNSIAIVMETEGKPLDQKSQQFLKDIVDFLIEEYNKKE
jgi:hypothetical protein